MCLLCAPNGKNQTHTKQMKLMQQSDVLAIHLIRFAPEEPKNHARISLPEIIDIAPFLEDKNSSSIKYRLFAVVNHIGNEIDSGHYTAIIRNLDTQWFQYNDEQFTEYDLNNLDFSELWSFTSANQLQVNFL